MAVSRSRPSVVVVATTIFPRAPIARGALASIVLAALLAAGLILTGCLTRKPTLERFRNDGGADARDFPDAPAVLLLDRTEVTLAGRGDGTRPMAEVQRTRRVRVLSDAGRALTRVLVPFDERSRVWSIQARVLREDGTEVRMHEAAVVDVDRFKDGPQARLYDGPGYKLAKVPDVDVGDVFEVTTLLRYRDPRWLEPLVVGGDLPILRGEVVVNVQQGLDVDMRVTRQGEVRDVKPTRIPTSLSLLSEKDPLPEGLDRGTRHAWVFEREPAVYPEGMAADPAALATQVHVLLRGGAGAFRSVDDVAAWYHEVVDGMDQPDAEVRRLAGALRGSKMDKVKAVQRFLQDDIADTPTFGNLAALRARTPGDIIRYKVGDSKDQASLALALLRAAGIDGSPVLVSRHGSFASVPDLPTPAPFNHVVVAVPMGGSYAWIDPATPGLPTGRLPAELQGAVGVLVGPSGGDLLTLPEDDEKKNAVDVRVEVTLDKAGRLSGVVKATLTGVDAARARVILTLPEEQQPAAMKALLLGARFGDPDGADGVPFQDVFRLAARNEADKDEAVKVQVRLAALDVGIDAVTPERLLGRPWGFLWREGRRSPTFLGARRMWTVRLDLKLPEGLGVAELPVSLEKSGSLVDIVERWAVADGVLTFQRTLTNHERIIGPARYADLRAPVVASWARARQPVQLVAGGDRGTTYGRDEF
jgi:hypothetical protein